MIKRVNKAKLEGFINKQVVYFDNDCSIHPVRIYTEVFSLHCYSYTSSIFQQGGFQFKGMDTHL